MSTETYVLHITKECNMMCRYCYEQDKTSTYEWHDIKELLDDIVKYNNNFSLEFLGGEPCLRTDLIKKTVKYLSNINDVNVQSFMITTNGTIVDDVLIETMKKYNNVSYAFSMDGNNIMNCLRIMKTGHNSHDIVVKNAKKMLELFGPDRISCHFVTHPYNIGYLNDGIDHLYNIGIRSFGIGTIESTIIIDEDYCKTFIKQHKILSDRIKKGELPNINISLFSWLKPITDERHYIKDDTGKTILETYGRAKNDIKDTNKYNNINSFSDLGNTIYFIREAVYFYHNNIKENPNNNPYLKYI